MSQLVRLTRLVFPRDSIAPESMFQKVTRQQNAYKAPSCRSIACHNIRLICSCGGCVWAGRRSPADPPSNLGSHARLTRWRARPPRGGAPPASGTLSPTPRGRPTKETQVRQDLLVSDRQEEGIVDAVPGRDRAVIDGSLVCLQGWDTGEH